MTFEEWWEKEVGNPKSYIDKQLAEHLWKDARVEPKEDDDKCEACGGDKSHWTSGFYTCP